MSYAGAQSAIRAYSQAGVHGGVSDASPHRLVQMMLDGALARIAGAKGRMLNHRIPEKCVEISRALEIVRALRAVLDKQAGGDIARNLEDLYDYIERRLFKANADNDPAVLDEVSGLLREIKSGWDAIASTVG